MALPGLADRGISLRAVNFPDLRPEESLNPPEQSLSPKP